MRHRFIILADVRFRVKLTPMALPCPYGCASRKREALLKAASNETELSIDKFPVECPYSIVQVLDGEFLPDAIDL